MIRFFAFEQDFPTMRISNAFIESYIPVAPSDYVKVYLYGLMLSQKGNQEFDVAGALGLTEETVAEAFLYWQRQGVVRVIPGENPAIMYADVIKGEAVRFDKNNDEMAGLLGKIQSLLGGRVIGLGDTSKIYDWVKIYGLSEDAVVRLVKNYIDERGPRSFVSFNTLDKTAKIWADAGVVTLADAEAFIMKRNGLKNGLNELLQHMGYKRAPTEDEKTQYDKWLKAGFTKEAIIAACSGLLVYSRPTFKNLDDVLQVHVRNGSFTVEQVRADQEKAEKFNVFMGTIYTRLDIVHAPTYSDKELIAQWRSAWGMEDELIFFAADCTAGQQYRFAAFKKLVNDWHAKGITRYVDARADHDKSTISIFEKSRKVKSKASAYLQRPEEEDQSKNFVINYFDD